MVNDDRSDGAIHSPVYEFIIPGATMLQMPTKLQAKAAYSRAKTAE